MLTSGRLHVAFGSKLLEVLADGGSARMKRNGVCLMFPRMVAEISLCEANEHAKQRGACHFDFLGCL